MNKQIKVFAAVVISGAVLLAVSSVWDESLIVDEIPHVGSGYSYLVKGDMRLNPEHPPLAKDLAALPLIFLNLDQGVFNTKYWQNDLNGQWEFGRHLIYQSGNNADLITHLTKLPLLIFFILSAVIVLKWANNLYGPAAGVIALILFAFSPLVLAHARFVTTDVAALWGVLLSSYFFIGYLKAPSKKSFMFSALTIGLALLTKFSVFLILPFFFLMLIIRERKVFMPILKIAALSIVGFLLVVWPVYYFHTFKYPIERQYEDTQQILSSYGNRYFAEPVIWLSDKPILRAAGHYALGLLMVNQRSAGGNTTYFLGEVTNQGSRIYFPVVYFIKEPLAWWGLVIMALLASVYFCRKHGYKIRDFGKKHLDEIAMILWLLIYWAVSIRSNLNIGARHLLPIYPFAIILVAGQVSKLINSFKDKKGKLSLVVAILPAALIGWYVYESISVYPYYLTYFNQIAGGPSGGHRYVTDSNLDWGQDLKRLSVWAEKNNIDKLYLDYFGWADPDYYLGDKWVPLHSGNYNGAADFLRRNPEGGYLAISGSFYMTSRENPNTSYAWLDDMEPLEVIGNSIFIWFIAPK